MLATEAHQGLLSVYREHRGRALHLCLGGELDMATTPVLEEWLSEAESDGNSAIVLNLEHVTFIDTCGLHSFLRAVKRARRTGRSFSIVKSRPAVRRIFEVTGTSFLLDGEEPTA